MISLKAMKIFRKVRNFLTVRNFLATMVANTKETTSFPIKDDHENNFFQQFSKKL